MDKFQWIAVWQLLYHLEHPACYQSRLQLISGHQHRNNLIISQIQLAR